MNKTLAATLAFFFAISLFLAADARAQECPNAQNMRLTAKQNHLDLNENAPFCVTKNASGEIEHTFEIKIQPPVQVDPGDVTVEKKPDETEVTITGNNSLDAGTLTITVSGNPGDKTKFGYLIKVNDIGCLDPTVRIIDNHLAIEMHMQALEDYFRANGVRSDERSTLLKQLTSN